ncbi:MAG TPA: threonine--tRNA ligase [Clostridia bacterium]|nr:threonine--tRNA ligase [Clostridia bacterium]
MKIKLRDNIVEFQDGMTLMEIAKSISEGLARNSLVAKVNGKATDLSAHINEDCEVEFLTFKDEEGKKAYRHSTSHILAQAVKRIYPDVKDAIGPAIEKGFYYDFDFITPLDRENGLAGIEEEMGRIIKADYKFEREEVSKLHAMELMKNEPYKLELIQELPEDATITIYRQGEFADLCAGPHVPSTGYIKAFKLTSATGAYWRGNEKNKMLTRIYGTSFDKKSDLEDYLAQVEEAKKRDHNKLGRELEIFMTDENIGQGLPLLMPKGAKLLQILQRFVEDEEGRRGYVLTKTPYMAKRELYKISGHWDHYQDGMFILGGDPDAEGEVFALRPMTCPFQYTIYNNGIKSYKDLPLRYGETSTLFRNESSGEMHGLIRLRQFTISEGHLICTPDHLEQEFKGCLDLAMYLLRCLGLLEDVSFRFSRWDPNNTEKYINDPEKWERAENEMKRILDDLGVKYHEAKDEAAFYGPKLDIQIRNVFGKEDTLVTIQIDMFLAERFDMSYIDENGAKARPYIIHRTSLGCYERTIALLIEKYAGAFPLWMAPLQVKVISLTDRTAADATEIADKLNRAGIRAEADNRNESMKYKVRDFQLKKIPYALIIGDKEKEENVVAVRDRKEGMIGTVPLDEFISRVKDEISAQISY